MEYHYQIYGIAVVSTIELPYLLVNEKSPARPIRIKYGQVPDHLADSSITNFTGHVFAEKECIIRIPGVAHYHISGGDTIVIEPKGAEQEKILTFCYNYGIPAVLMQRDIILLHVSGIFTEPGKILLLAAHSGTGKSTTAIMLGERGYRMFTDDTALLTIEGNKCFAVASYPQTRLWQNSVAVQNTYRDEDKKPFKTGIDKYVFSFADDFTHEKVEITGIVFIEKKGENIIIENLSHLSALQLLDENIYARGWINGMKKNKLLFMHSTQIAHTIPCWRATRPAETESFQSFADAIIEKIICNESSKKALSV